MKTLRVFVIAALILFVVTCRGDSYDKIRDVEDDFQDRFANKVNERRERLKSMFDPRCLTWTRRKPTGCANGKRSFAARRVSIFSFSFGFSNSYSSYEGDVHKSLSRKAVFNGDRNPKTRCSTPQFGSKISCNFEKPRKP